MLVYDDLWETVLSQCSVQSCPYDDDSFQVDVSSHVPDVVPGGRQMGPSCSPTTSQDKQSPQPGANQPLTRRTSRLTTRAPPKSTVDIKKALAEQVAGSKTVDDNYDKDDSLDGPLGSYNMGDSMEEWAECLDFFCINATEYLARTEGFGGAAPILGHGPRKRAGIKKLYGMSVSLFDYQLMGVYRLIKKVTHGGGFLADACGIGKTLEMLGVFSTARALRAMMSEVKVAASGKKFDSSRHLAPGAPEHAKCPSEKKYGVRCPCHCALSGKIAALLPEGPNLLLTPAKTASQLCQEAEQKLDGSVFVVRLNFPKNDKVGANNVVVVVPYPLLSGVSRLSSPGIIFADEFHEVCNEENRVIGWLRDQMRSAKHEDRRPLVYFTSATPIETGPMDLTAPLSVLERPTWSDQGHPMAVATVVELEVVGKEFRNIMDRQIKGQEVGRDEVQAYRARFDRLLNAIMIRRLATDSFRGRPITDLGPMSVTTQHCAVPQKYKRDVQALADLAMREAHNAVADGLAESVAGLFATREAATVPAIAALRVAATFPATAATLRLDPSRLSDASISKELRAADGQMSNTRFWHSIASWTRNSPKLAAVLEIAQTMAADTSPIEGESSRAKKLCIFTATDAEAMLIYAFLLQARTTQTPPSIPLRPVWLHPAALPPAGATLEDKVVTPFQTMGNHTPNILVASMARAGTGLNFPQAKYCVVTGPGFRKSDSTQVFGRCHRVRQKQRTRLLLLVSRGNPLDRRLYDSQQGLAVLDGEEAAWAVAADGDVIPGEGVSFDLRSNVK